MPAVFLVAAPSSKREARTGPAPYARLADETAITTTNAAQIAFDGIVLLPSGGSTGYEWPIVLAAAARPDGTGNHSGRSHLRQNCQIARPEAVRCLLD
jgi:hypothetical protein